jgi:diguanylate cyclase (GGDEF)-like protein/PAS domain S-box-containing protein
LTSRGGPVDPKTRTPDGFGLVLLAFSQFALSHVCAKAFSLHPGVSALWFPAGFSLAALLMVDKRARPGLAVALWLGEFADMASRGVPIGLALVLACGSVASALVGAAVLGLSSSFSPQLRSMRDYLLLVVVAVAGASVMLGLGVAFAAMQSGRLPNQTTWHLVREWWGAHIVGLVVLAPLLLVWRDRSDRAVVRQRLREMLSLLVLGGLMGQVVLTGWFNDPAGLLSQPYWLFIAVAAAAPRLGRLGVSALMVIFAIQGFYGVTHSVGMFAVPDTHVALANYWLIMVTLPVFGMAGAAYFERLRRAQAEVVRQEASYRSQFADNSAVFVLFELDGSVIDANQAALTFYGHSREALKKLTLYEISMRTTAEVRDTLQNMGPNGGGRFESRHRLADGSVRDVSVSVSMVQMAGRLAMHAIMFDITDKKRAEAEIENLAFFDPLTRLPNRRLLLDRLGQALSNTQRNGRKGALLFIDLDNFKTLNDAHGHEKGDRLLVQTGQRLRECVRFGDTVARLGGDEFVVMLKDLQPQPHEAASQVKVVAAKVLAALNQPYQLEGIEYHGSGSLGVALFGDPADNIDELFKRADMALYEAKGMGRNAMRFFDPVMQAAMQAKAQTASELRRALETGQLVLYYQPQVDATGQLIGLEALVRWLHPERGVVSPASFIAVAEETGLILPLGQEVLRLACTQAVAWGQHPVLGRLPVSVNVSARQFRQADYVQTVASMLQQTGAPATRIKLELTESLLIVDVDDVINKMLQLRGMGLRFALDDFGTGYSSLVYLKRMPLEQLKIDQAFVRDLLTDPNDAAISKVVITLGHSLGLEVLAEGVESPEQREALLQQGCDAFQGYLFGVPMEAAKLTQRYG